jgi:hypothetical protein
MQFELTSTASDFHLPAGEGFLAQDADALVVERTPLSELVGGAQN